MADPTTTELIEVLAGQATAASVPPPPVAKLLERAGEQRRARTRRAAVLIAAGVAGVVAVSAVLLTQRQPVVQRPVAPPTSNVKPGLEHLPPGPPPRGPYSTAKSVTIFGTTFMPNASVGFVQQAGEYATYLEGDTVLRVLRRSTATIGPAAGIPFTIFHTPAVGGGVLDPTGTYVAWEKPGSGPAVVVVHRLDGTEPDREQTFPGTPTCCDNPFYIDAINSDGVLVANLAWHTWSWNFRDRGPVRELRGLAPESGVEQAAGSRFVASVNATGQSVVGTIDPSSGRFVEERRFAVNPVVLDLPEGRRVAYVVGTTLRISGLDDATDISIGLPSDAYVSAPRWEDADHVMLSATRTVNARTGPLRTLLVRCSLTTRTCEIALDSSTDVHLGN